MPRYWSIPVLGLRIFRMIRSMHVASSHDGEHDDDDEKKTSGTADNQKYYKGWWNVSIGCQVWMTMYLFFDSWNRRLLSLKHRNQAQLLPFRRPMRKVKLWCSCSYSRHHKFHSHMRYCTDLEDRPQTARCMRLGKRKAMCTHQCKSEIAKGCRPHLSRRSSNRSRYILMEKTRAQQVQLQRTSCWLEFNTISSPFAPACFNNAQNQQDSQSSKDSKECRYSILHCCGLPRSGGQ